MRKNKLNWILMVVYINFVLDGLLTYGELCSSGSESISGKCNQANSVTNSLSQMKMGELLEQEMVLYDVMREYRMTLKARLDLINYFIEDFEGTEAGMEMLLWNLFESNITDSYSLIRAFEISKNPFTIYRMIERYTSRLPELIQNLETKSEKKLLEKLNKLELGSKFK